MKKPWRSQIYILAVFLQLMVISSCTTNNNNWPQFRGPDGNMLSTNTNLPSEWGNDLNIAWIADLDGKGWSSPIIWGEKVFVTSTYPVKVNPVPERPPMNGPPPTGGQPTVRGQMPQPGQAGPPNPAGPRPEENDTSYLSEIYRWQVTCFDLKTGKKLWNQVAYDGQPRGNKNPLNTYASETPVTDGKRVYAYFGMTGLFCYDMDGNLLWKKDLGAYKTQKGWGTGSSPVLFNNKLFIQYDNEENSFLTAIDAATGNEVWRATRDEKTTYSTPYIWKNKVRTELVACGKTARSYDPETGKLLWELKIGGEQVIPSPIGNEDLLFIGNAGGREAKAVLFAVRAGGEGSLTEAGIAWKSEEATLGSPSPLLYNGLLYLIGSRGEISVLDAMTGKLKYSKRINGIAACWASPWANDGKIMFFDEKGITRSFEAGEQNKMLNDNKLDDKLWGSVAIAGNSCVFRGEKKLFCVR